MAARKRKTKATYVDGFVLVIPRKNLSAYRRLARKAGQVWRKYGALEFRECAADDMSKMGVSFPRRTKAKRGEMVIFSWIVYKSRQHRDEVNAKVMKDKWMKNFDSSSMPFDTKRMSYGGFKIIVDA